VKPTPHVLYLDFDGVLHPEGVYWHPKRGVYIHAEYERAGHRLFEHAQLLESLLTPYPDVAIVLSTSWVRQYRFKGTAKRLPPGLQARCVGATFHTQMDRYAFDATARGLQVQADVVRRRPSTWLALDDVDEGWERAREHVLITDAVHGISEPNVLEQLCQALTRFHGS
jgi:hypothetical protein